MSPADAAVVAPPNRVLAEQVYDAIMAAIEEDLLLANIPHLPEKYKNETPEEHESRMDRYKEAYRRFDQEFSKLMLQVNEEVHTQKREALQAKEAEAKTQDAMQLSTIESAFT